MIMSGMVMTGEREKHSASRVGVAVVAAAAAVVVVVIVLLPKRISAFHPRQYSFSRIHPSSFDTCESSQLVSSTVNLSQHSYALRTRIGVLGLELT